MSREFNPRRKRLAKNLIKYDSIHLKPDFDNNMLHFEYKNAEVTCELNLPETYKNKNNPEGLLRQIIGEYNQIEECKEDFFRKMIIYMDIKSITEDEDEEDEYDDDVDEDIDNEDDDDENDTPYTDKLKAHYPGCYLTPEQEKGYDGATRKKDLANFLLEDDNIADTLFPFAYIKGMKIYDDRIEFMAPNLSMDIYEWIFWACNTIDKVLEYKRKMDEEDDELDFDYSVDDE